MDVSDVLRTTGAIRQFTKEPVDDAVLYAVLDDARFAPSGGNRQAWHVVVIKDEHQRRGVGGAYLDAWHDYVAHHLAGLIPFSPLASEDDRLAALGQREAAEQRSQPDGFAETFADIPVMLVISADLAVLAAIDRDLGRYQLVGGASVYPFVWSILLAARARGLGGVITTMAVRNEPEMKELLGLPATHAVAAVVALGHYEHRSTKLTRRAVEEFTTVDRFGGEPLRP
jgi:nitroreductase